MKNQKYSISTLEEEPQTQITNFQLYTSCNNQQEMPLKTSSQSKLIPESINTQSVKKLVMIGLPSQISNRVFSYQPPLQQLQMNRKKLDLSQQEVNFFIKNILPFKRDQYHQQFQCEIKVNQYHQPYLNQITSTLSYQGRKLIISYADIVQFDHDGIVNSYNNLMQFENIQISQGVAQNYYTKFWDNFIQNNVLEFGKVVKLNIPGQNQGVQKYMINISTPIYQQNMKKTNQDYLKIEQKIKAIFVEANQRNIPTLAFSLFDGGTCGYSFQEIVNNVLNIIINNLYSYNNSRVQIVYVMESIESKIIQICQVLRTTLQPPKTIRQIKYQWQWNNDISFQNYDEDTNRQIDEGYEQFLTKGTPSELKLVFPVTQQPGTHFVDLQKMIINDIEHNITIKMSLSRCFGNERYLFNNKEIDPVINQYFLEQKLNHHFQFEIFYKKHKIIFNSNGCVQQINQETGYQRQVQFIPYLKQQKQINQNIIVGKPFNLVQKDDHLLNTQLVNEIVLESLNSKVIDNLQKTIKEDIIQETVNVSISLPLIKQEDFINLKAYIIKKSIKSHGKIENGKKVTLQIFKAQYYKIKSYIDKVIANSKKYPINWIPQDKNIIKVDLSRDSEEYKQIEAEFKKTDNGKISKISRLQNQRLWENYQSEKQKLQNISIEKNTPLTLIEQERYLWHGVKGQHPKSIYQGDKEAFDITYSKSGMWGTGIYFAERAKYSRSYSYVLTQQDDQLHAGKLVVLYCRVTTGKIYQCQSNNTLQRPPNGYDCVSGFTDGSNVFILYGMDVRRAYPGYEIIYS